MKNMQLSSSKRRVTITKFGYEKAKDTIRVDIREFYEKDSQHLPGKKVRPHITQEREL
jgi:predicted transcriptional regulator